MTMSNRTRFVTRGKIRLAYTPAESDSGPAVLALHDLLADRRSFEGVRSEFGAKIRFITPDLRGHGASAAVADKTLTIDDLAFDVQAILDAEGIASVTIAGHGLGAAVACSLALLAPERIGGMVLLDPSIWNLPLQTADSAAMGDLRAADRKAAEAAYGGQASRGVDLYLASRFGADWRMDLPPAKIATAQRSDAALVRLLPALADWQVEPHAIATIQCPVTILSPLNSHPAMHRIAAALTDLLPDGTLLLVEETDWQKVMAQHVMEIINLS